MFMLLTLSATGFKTRYELLRDYYLNLIAKKFQEFQGKPEVKKDNKKAQKPKEQKPKAAPKEEKEVEEEPKPKPSRDPFAALPEGLVSL